MNNYLFQKQYISTSSKLAKLIISPSHKFTRCHMDKLSQAHTKSPIHFLRVSRNVFTTLHQQASNKRRAICSKVEAWITTENELYNFSENIRFRAGGEEGWERKTEDKFSLVYYTLEPRQSWYQFQMLATLDSGRLVRQKKITQAIAAVWRERRQTKLLESSENSHKWGTLFSCSTLCRRYKYADPETRKSHSLTLVFNQIINSLGIQLSSTNPTTMSDVSVGKGRADSEILIASRVNGEDEKWTLKIHCTWERERRCVSDTKRDDLQENRNPRFDSYTHQKLSKAEL